MLPPSHLTTSPNCRRRLLTVVYNPLLHSAPTPHSPKMIYDVRGEYYQGFLSTKQGLQATKDKEKKKAAAAAASAADAVTANNKPATDGAGDAMQTD